jgi:uroporphyrinogen-III decarboxylase
MEKKMDDRERFLDMMAYKPVDRLPVMSIETLIEGPALDRYRREGLPNDTSPLDYLGIKTFQRLPVSFEPMPGFERRIVSDDESEYVEIDGMGATVRRMKEAPKMYYGYIDHPVKTREDWEQYKRRFDPDSPGRLPENLENAIAELNASQRPTHLNLFPFFFRLGFYLLGMERFLTAFYDEPELIHDMFSFWSGFVMKTIHPLLGRVRIDCVSFTEDLAYKGGPHISPKIYEEFWLPYQDPIVHELRRHGMEVICLWSAGNIDVLIPLLMEHGVNCFWPVERGSGMDPAALRSKYGRALRMGGGIPKEALIEGPAAIDRELERLLPLIKEGGYLPALDDVVPPEVPFDTYRHYAAALRAVTV